MNSITSTKTQAKNDLQLQISFLTSLSFLASADEFEEWGTEVKANILALLTYLAVEVRRLSKIVFGN